MDRWLFESLNQWAGWGYWTDGLAWLLALGGPSLLVALLLIRWFFPGARPRQERRTVLLTVAGVFLALGFCQMLTMFYYRYRPFLTLPGAFNLLGVFPSASFPSDHAAVAFVASILMGWDSRLWSMITWPLALGVCWSRVYGGAHYPSDILGSLIVAFLASVLLVGLRPHLEPALDAILYTLSPRLRRR